MKGTFLKFSILTLLFTFSCQNLMAAGTDDFVIKVKTDLPGTSASNQFRIQTLGTGYNYNVDCNLDGIFEATAQTSDYICIYPASGSIKFIRIEDNNGDGTGFPRIYYNNTGDHRKITELVQWGTGKWTSMGDAFRGAQNMIVTAGDVPDLSNVTNLSSMFRFASLANPDTSNWDVSHVTNMHSMFRSASAANPNTNNWNTSHVTVMTDMFRNAIAANPDVSNWDITHVTDMSLMFANVTLPTSDYDAMLTHFANQNVMNSVIFDGGNSQYCSIAAQSARAHLIANKNWTITDGGQCANSDPLNDFVFTVTTNLSGSPSDATFTIPTNGSGYKYNVDCNNDGTYDGFGITGDYTCDYTAIGGAGTYTIRVQDAMGDKTGFPRIDFTASTEGKEIIDISQWGTGIWTSMENAFRQTSNLQISATDAPDLSQVTSLKNMFRLSLSLTTVGTNWDTSNIENMSYMFYTAGLAQPQTSNWVTDNVTDMTAMFYAAQSAQPDTSGWNTAHVKFMPAMFYQAFSANPDTNGWNIEQVTAMQQIFFDVTLPTNDYDAMLSGFNAQNLQPGVTFDGGNSKYCDVTVHDGLVNTHGWTITDGGLNVFCAPNADDFIIAVNTNNTSKGSSIKGSGSSSNTQYTIPLSTNATILSQYNYNVDCDLDHIGTNTATGLTGSYTCNYATPGIYTIAISDNTGLKTGFPAIKAIANNENLKIIELKQWGTGIWKTMQDAFLYASNMTVTATDIPDLSNVESIGAIFAYAALANPDVSGWDTSHINYMASAFLNATIAEPDVSNWDTSQVTNMGTMFANATAANPDVSSWDTSHVNSMLRMFLNASSANPDVSGWDTSNVTNVDRMFSGATLADPDVSGWNTANVTGSLDFMFEHTAFSTHDLTGWDVSGVTSMVGVFSFASSANPDVSNWDTSSVTDMSFMFRYATAANPDLSHWDVSHVTDMTTMFLDVTLSLTNYDALLQNFSSQNLHNNVTFHAGNSTYCNTAAHDIIENTFNWSITDGGLDASCPSDDIFADGFESVIVFKAADKQFKYDFSEISIEDMHEQPLLIAKGLDKIKQSVIQIYLRNDLGQLQIRMDNYDDITQTWEIGQWQSINNTELTVISWPSKPHQIRPL